MFKLYILFNYKKKDELVKKHALAMLLVFPTYYLMYSKSLFFFDSISRVITKQSGIYALSITALYLIKLKKNISTTKLENLITAVLIFFYFKNEVFLKLLLGFRSNLNIYNNIAYYHTPIATTLLYAAIYTLANEKKFEVIKKKNIERVYNSRSVTSALILGSIWSSQEVLWQGYWNWDQVENGVLLVLIFYLIINHSKNKTINYSNQVFDKNLILLVPVLFFPNKSDFSNSVHSFVSNSVSSINVNLKIAFSILFLLNLFKTVTKSKYELAFTIFVLTLLLNSLFLLINIKSLNYFKLVSIIILIKITLNQKSSSDIIKTSKILNIKILSFIVLKQLFIKWNIRNLLNHAAPAIITAMAVVFVISKNQNTTSFLHINLNCLELTKITLCQNSLNLDILEILRLSTNTRSLIKFRPYNFEGGIAFEVFFSRSNYLVYINYLKINFLILIFFSLRKKKCFY